MVAEPYVVWKAHHIVGAESTTLPFAISVGGVEELTELNSEFDSGSLDSSQ